MAGTRVNVWMILEGGGAEGRKVRVGDGVDIKHHPRHYHQAHREL